MFELYEGEKERRETTQKTRAVGAAVARDVISFDTADHAAQVRGGGRREPDDRAHLTSLPPLHIDPRGSI